MFTEEDKQKCNKGWEQAIKFGGKIGDFIHAKAKGITRATIVAVVVIIFGGIFMFVTLLKRSFGQKN
jgi:hypothetical protein